MSQYMVFLKYTDTCFFDGEAKSEEEAIKYAEEELIGVYPNDKGKNINWSILDMDNPLG
jgi:hypothetical protein